MSLDSPFTIDVRSLVQKLDREARHVLSEAANLAYRRMHAVLDIEHFLISTFTNENELCVQLERKGFPVDSARAQLERKLMAVETVEKSPPAFSSELTKVLRDCWLSVSLDSTKLSQICLADVLGFVVADEVIFSELCKSTPALFQLKRAMLTPQVCSSPVGGKLDGSSALTKFTLDLTARAATGQTDPVIGREAEVSQVIEVLLRRRQNNPILVGEAGVGKTAVVEGLAQRIAARSVPDALRNVRLCSLDMGLLKAGAGVRGELESRLKAIISEVANAEPPIVLFIDEAHAMVAGSSSSGEQSDIANLIKPELARGTLRTIAATTWAEYKRYFEKDAALTRRFQLVRVNEPSAAATEDILQGLLPALQKHHGVHVMQNAIETAVRLSNRYLQTRQQPDKAISVLDTACARAVASQTAPGNERLRLSQRLELLTARLQALVEEQCWSEDDTSIEATKTEMEVVRVAIEEASASAEHDMLQSDRLAQTPRVTSEGIASVIADWTGVPTLAMLEDQYSVAMHLEDRLAQRVIGQRSGIRLICERVRAYTAKLGDPDKPLGVFMLAGPSGVGKTETAHALAEAFFGHGGITSINMSEYQEAHTVSKLKGAPAGYVGYGQGGVLTEAIRRKPYGLLLLDEVERAHPDVLDLFLQIFDKGFLEDSEGVGVDFRNTLIVLTSNVASERLEAFGDPDRRSANEHENLHEALQRDMRDVFAPALLGRVHVVPYFALNPANLRSIVEMKLAAVVQRFEQAHRRSLSYEPNVVDMLVNRCASQSLGARWIDQYLAAHVLNRLSDCLLGILASRTQVRDLKLVIVDGEVSVLEAEEKARLLREGTS